MNENELNVDIAALLRILRKYIVVISIFTVLGTVAAFAISEFVLEKRYAASAKFYIENSKQQTEIINVGDITAARNMVNTCAELFSTRNMAQRLKDISGVDYTVDELLDMLSMGTSNNTEFLVITVTADNSRAAVNLLTYFVDICLDEFAHTIDSGRIRVVDSPYSSGKPVFPNMKLALVLGFMAGFLLTYLVVFIIEIVDTKVKPDDDLYKQYKVPVFAEIMNFSVKSKEA